MPHFRACWALLINEYPNNTNNVTNGPTLKAKLTSQKCQDVKIFSLGSLNLFYVIYFMKQ